MYPNMTIGRPHFGPGYVPYFYAAGRFMSYDLPRPHAPLEVRFVLASSYDFTSDLVQKRGYPAPQTVEQVIRNGYLAIPESEPETALITDKKHTARFGLDDVIGQIRKRYEVYEKNIYEIEWSKCEAINCLYRHIGYHGPTDSKVEYSVSKRMNELYMEQRAERVNLWRDVSRLRLELPENAHQYLSAYRKVSILEDDQGDAL
jgi:hypothetical protein